MRPRRPGLTSTAPFALALGGGGARGLAHVGVLQVLEREGLRPTAIAGTSIGAVVGALYAAGVAPDDLATELDLLDLKGLAGVAKISLRRGSVLSAVAVANRLEATLPGTFAELGMPFAAVAADLVTGQRVIFKDGALPIAVRASMSIPVVFEPVRIGDMLLVDGGIIDPVPVDAALEIGGQRVVAVDVGPLMPPSPRGSSPRGSKPILRVDAPTAAQIGTRAFDIGEHWLARPALAAAIAVIAPEVGGYYMADFLEGADIIELGRQAAEASVPAIRAALAEPVRDPLSRWWRRVRS